MKQCIDNRWVVVIARTASEDIIDNGDSPYRGDNPYRETIAVGYDVDADCLQIIILCEGNGSGDHRILGEYDLDETYPVELLEDAANEIRSWAPDTEYEEDFADLADYIDDQIKARTENEVLA